MGLSLKKPNSIRTNPTMPLQKWAQAATIGAGKAPTVAYVEMGKAPSATSITAGVKSGSVASSSRAKNYEKHTAKHLGSTPIYTSNKRCILHPCRIRRWKVEVMMSSYILPSTRKSTLLKLHPAHRMLSSCLQPVKNKMSSSLSLAPSLMTRPWVVSLEIEVSSIEPYLMSIKGGIWILCSDSKTTTTVLSIFDQCLTVDINRGNSSWIFSAFYGSP
ncbi:hypothetical protein PIB30_032091 [Stylosanthes scabra]|uniref:Uncharacterized protein n=1 Tax=Stylosanthes scabra TaxID=79078 RepID=A0ABU6TDU5_9FABA|nr:hypothetical protein [Stylosanthes scabra]